MTDMTQIKSLIEASNAAFEVFKAEHSQQLAEVKKGSEDAIRSLQVERISADVSRLQAAVDEANTKLASAELSMTQGPSLVDADYTQAFRAHFRKGEVQAKLHKGLDGDGGYLAPVEWDRTITEKLVEISPMRQLASTQSVSGNGFTKLYHIGGTDSGWVGESDPRPETATGKFAPLNYGWGEIYANPAASQQMLDDAAINLEQWLASEVNTSFAQQEGAAFLNGDGSNKPFGLMTYLTGAANASKHPFGPIKVMKSGNKDAITADSIIDVIHDLPTPFTANARFAMNRKTQGELRKLKDGQGNYLWQPSYAAGQPATLSGFPITEVADLANVATNAVPLLFGDFSRTYTVLDRIGVRVLRDPFTAKPHVLFYTTKRVGGGVTNPETMRALKVAA